MKSNKNLKVGNIVDVYIDPYTKNIFEGNEDIIFVSNEENFKETLKTAEYEEYFIDRFAGNFGHCTPKGNRLIAENLTNVILEELNID